MAIETYELFAGLVEFGLAMQLRQIVTVTDTRDRAHLAPGRVAT